MQTLRLCNWGIFFIIGVENKNMIRPGFRAGKVQIKKINSQKSLNIPFIKPISVLRGEFYDRIMMNCSFI
mgnify:CR=1 FL=1